MAEITMKELLEAGVHFGHQTRRWNPKMKRFILTERAGIYVIDLHQSLGQIDRAGAPPRQGGGHVALYIGEDNECYHCAGGNQSDKSNYDSK